MMEPLGHYLTHADSQVRILACLASDIAHSVFAFLERLLTATVSLVLAYLLYADHCFCFSGGFPFKW